jgi:hypothetical protein
MKFYCQCNNIIADQVFPNPIGFRIIADQDLDRLAEPIGVDAFWDESSRVLKCDRCGRLWIAWKDNKEVFAEFVSSDADNS